MLAHYLPTFQEIDLANEAEARQRYLTKMAGKQIPTTDVPLGGYIRDTDYTAFCVNIVEYATFKRLFFTTGYSKAYWNNPNTWRHVELDMCHIPHSVRASIKPTHHGLKPE